MKTISIKIPGDRPLDRRVVEELAGAACDGRLIIFPTDTVYGVGTSGLRPEALGRIYDLKDRDSRKPLPILVHSMAAAWRWVERAHAAEALAGRFWPGALTLVLRPTAEGRRLLTAGSPTLAVRVPDQPALLGVIEASGVPWASTSANLSGCRPVPDGEAALASFDGRVDYVIDGGPSRGEESTVVDATGPTLRVLRQGPLSRRFFEDCS